jgi:hypothetical protein
MQTNSRFFFSLAVAVAVAVAATFLALKSRAVPLAVPANDCNALLLHLPQKAPFSPNSLVNPFDCVAQGSLKGNLAKGTSVVEALAMTGDIGRFSEVLGLRGALEHGDRARLLGMVMEKAMLHRGRLGDIAGVTRVVDVLFEHVQPTPTACIISINLGLAVASKVLGRANATVLATARDAETGLTLAQLAVKANLVPLLPSLPKPITSQLMIWVVREVDAGMQMNIVKSVLDTVPQERDHVDENGWDALFYAVVRLRGPANGDLEVVRMLLEAGWEVGRRDKRGWTCVHYAVVVGDVPTLRLLARFAGAVVNTARNKDGRTPLDLAKMLLPAEPYVLKALCEECKVPATSPRNITRPLLGSEAEEREADRAAGWGSEADPDLGETLDHCNFDVIDAGAMRPSEFVRDYVALAKPALIRNAMTNWAAFRHWAREAVVERYGTCRLHAGVVPYGKYSGLPDKFFGERTVSAFLSEHMVRGKGDADDFVSPWLLFSNRLNQQSGGRFLEDFEIPRLFASLCPSYSSPQFSLGYTGAGASFHFHAAAFNGLAFGLKRWFIVRSGFAWREGVNGNQPIADWLLGQGKGVGTGSKGGPSYPALAKSGALAECVQRPGDVVYVPALAAHGTVNLKTSVNMAQEFCAFDFKRGDPTHVFFGTLLTAEEVDRVSFPQLKVFPKLKFA